MEGNVWHDVTSTINMDKFGYSQRQKLHWAAKDHHNGATKRHSAGYLDRWEEDEVFQKKMIEDHKT